VYTYTMTPDSHTPSDAVE